VLDASPSERLVSAHTQRIGHAIDVIEPGGYQIYLQNSALINSRGTQGFTRHQPSGTSVHAFLYVLVNAGHFQPTAGMAAFVRIPSNPLSVLQAFRFLHPHRVDARGATQASEHARVMG
jgi:hypothetical protein